MQDDEPNAEHVNDAPQPPPVVPPVPRRPSRIPHMATPGRPKKRKPKPLPRGMPDWIEPWTRNRTGSGALVLAAGAWIAALAPWVPDRYDKYLFAAGGLCSVIAVAVQRVAFVRTNHVNPDDDDPA